MKQTKQRGADKPKHTETLVNNSAEENPDRPRPVGANHVHPVPHRHGWLTGIENRGSSGGRELTGEGRPGRAQARTVPKKGNPKTTPMRGPDKGEGVVESKTTDNSESRTVVLWKGKPETKPMSRPVQGVGNVVTKTVARRRKPNNGGPNATVISSRPGGGRRRGKGGRPSSNNTGSPGNRTIPTLRNGLIIFGGVDQFNAAQDTSTSSDHTSSPTPVVLSKVTRTRRRRSRKNKSNDRTPPPSSSGSVTPEERPVMGADMPFIPVDGFELMTGALNHEEFRALPGFRLARHALARCRGWVFSPRRWARELMSRNLVLVVRFSQSRPAGYDESVDVRPFPMRQSDPVAAHLAYVDVTWAVHETTGWHVCGSLPGDTGPVEPVAVWDSTWDNPPWPILVSRRLYEAALRRLSNAAATAESKSSIDIVDRMQDINVPQHMPLVYKFSKIWALASHAYGFDGGYWFSYRAIGVVPVEDARTWTSMSTMSKSK